MTTATAFVGTDDGLHEIEPGIRGGVTERGREIDGVVLDGGTPVHIADKTFGPVTGANCILPLDGRFLVGVTPASLRLVHDNVAEPVESFDMVEGNDEWHQPFPAPPDVRSIARDADGTLYVNVHVGGIIRSRDGGETWQPTIDLHADVHEVTAHPTRAGLVLAACAVGLAVSDDGGDSWTIKEEGLHSSYARAIAVAGDTVLVSTSRGAHGGQAALYRRPVDAGAGRPFERCEKGLPEWFEHNIDTFRIAAGANGTNGEVALASRDGRVFRSDDEGGAWTEIASGLPPVRCLALG